VLNADDPLVAAMATRTRGAVRTFGERQGCDVRLEDVVLDDLGRPGFDLVAGDERAHAQLRLMGEHQARNAAAAAAVALAVGVPLAQVAASLAAVTSISQGRMEVAERADGLTVINDAYNANPDSMRAGLKALAAIGRSRPGVRTVAVLGEMRELGPTSLEEHDAVGRLAVRLDIQQLLVVGEPARPIHLGASLEGSWGGESVFVPDHDAALAWLRDHLGPADVVLFKASNAARLDRLASAVLTDGEQTGESGGEAAAEEDRNR
jgi:UDP-N-acetylmuramoyl-tripeptide--D-alanyl-D-alanine ligase